MEETQQEVAIKRLRAMRMVEHPPSELCPRCQSEDTKFCYFNNYSSLQPRYFCKTCKRYWTKGGILRNIPHGGGPRRERKNKKSVPVPSSSSSSFAAVDPLIDGTGDRRIMEDPSVPVMGFGMTDPLAMPPPVYYGDGSMIGDLGTGSMVVPPSSEPKFFFGYHFLPTQPQPFFTLNPNLIPAPQEVDFTSTPAGGSGAVEPYWGEVVNDEEVEAPWAADLSVPLGRQPSPPPPFI